MAEGRVDAVVVGADRIAANGDAANKIGTYALSVLARAHGVPFYVAAPTSTIDAAAATGADIPIEQRDPGELAGASGARRGRRLQSRLRRDACRQHHRHRHRARRPSPALPVCLSRGLEHDLAALDPALRFQLAAQGFDEAAPARLAPTGCLPPGRR